MAPKQEKGKSVRYLCVAAASAALLAAPCAGADAKPPPDDAPRVPSFTLDDQFGREHAQVFPGEGVSILALADREGSDQLMGWIDPFYKHYGKSVSIRGVANLKGVPGVMRPVVRALFRNAVDYPVLMDWSGNVSAACGYEKGKANIFIVCPGGVVRLRINGAATAEDLQLCFHKLDALLEQGAAPAPSEESSS